MERIKELRKEIKYNQYELADYLGVSQQAISKYENGVNEPDSESLYKMAKLFNVSIDYLLGKSDVKNPETSDYDKMAEQICELLLEKGIIKQGEEPTEEQRENVLKFLDKAIDLFRI
ncbi:MAG: helix-turn-helix transcriptional regulator [Anaerostipes sp.]|nr:helix-turn-helix transcriptional regulator [Anaerostipes sp.]